MTETQRETMESLVAELEQGTLTAAGLREGIADIAGTDNPETAGCPLSASGNHFPRSSGSRYAAD